MRSTVLVVNDRESIRLDLAFIVRDCGFDVLTAADGEEATAALTTTTIDIILADLVMPRLDGYGLLRWMQSYSMRQPVLIIHDHTSSGNTAEILRLGAYDCIFKPFKPEDIKAALHRAETSVEHRRTEAALRRRNRELDALNAISTAVNSSLYLDKMLERALCVTVEALDLTGAIFYLTQANGLLRLFGSYGNFERLLDQIPKTITPLYSHSVAIGETQVAQALGFNEQIVWHKNEALKAAVPLLANGTLQGLLLLAGVSDYPMRHDHLALLESISNYVGVAIANIQLYKEVRDSAALLDRLVIQRTHELERSRDLLRTIFDGIPGGLLLVNTDGRILATNRAYADLLDIQPTALINQTYTQIWPDSWAETAAQLLERCCATGQAVYKRDRLDRSDFSLVILDHYLFPVLDTTGRIIQVIEYLENVTERLTLERMLTQSEQLAALGRLAAAVAHEVNTPLLSIRGCLSLIANAKVNRAARAEYLALAESELDRAATIIHSMLDFYRSAGNTQMQTDINSLITKVVQLLKAECAHYNVTVHLELSAKLPHIEVIPDQIKQLMFNLTINAIESLPDGGQITLRTLTRLVQTNAGAYLEAAQTLAEASSTDYTVYAPFLIIEVEDTGQGVPVELQKKIFDPFVTTKAEGTGLGLAVCRTIIHDHHGFINVTNISGKGARFTIGLPINDAHITEGEPYKA